MGRWEEGEKEVDDDKWAPLVSEGEREREVVAGKTGPRVSDSKRKTTRAGQAREEKKEKAVG